MARKLKFFKWEGKKALVMLISLLLIVTVGVGGVVAYIIDRTSELENSFVMGRVDSVPERSVLDGKKQVAIRNTGDTPAYIRVAMIITWVAIDEESEAHESVTHVDEPMWHRDYSIDYAWEDPNWQQNQEDGLWYYLEPIEGGELTPPLIYDYSKLASAQVPEGYKLSIEVLSSAIQASPANAVTESWGIEVVDGKLNFVTVQRQ